MMSRAVVPQRARRPHLATVTTIGARLHGRDTELARLEAQVASGRRVVTVTGAGGIGKTALMSAFVARARATRSFDGPIWSIDLSDARSGNEAAELVARALGIAPDASDASERIAQALQRSGDVLLALDNVEQFIDDAARLVVGWLERAPGLTCVVTSRELLRISAEYVLELGPLSTETTAADRSLAHEVLVDLSSSFRAEREWTKEEHASLAEIARRVDGVPLALVLAASRLRHMGPSELLGRLESVLDLTGARSDLPNRHLSLRSTLQWSWDLLGEIEARALASFSLFRGGFDEKAASGVLAQGIDADAVLASLQDRSLIRRAARGRARRFELLAPVREFAGEQLDRLGLRADVASRHALHFLRVGQSAPADWLADADVPQSDAEADSLNFAVAVDSALDGSAPSEEIARALPGIALAVFSAGTHAGWSTRLDRLLASGIAGADRARASLVRGLLAKYDGLRVASETFFAEALSHAEACADHELEAGALYFAVMSRISRGDAREACATLDRAIGRTALPAVRARARRAKCAALASQGAVEEAKTSAYELLLESRSPDSLAMVGFVLAITGDMDGAREVFENVAIDIRARESSRTLRGNLSTTLYNLVCIALYQGRYEDALTLARECADLSRLATHPDRVARTLVKAGAALYLLGDLGEAQRHFTDAIAVLVQAGISERVALYRAHLGAVAARLGHTREAAAIFAQIDQQTLSEQDLAVIAPLRVPLLVTANDARGLLEAREIVEASRRDERRFVLANDEIVVSRRMAVEAIGHAQTQGDATSSEVARDGTWVRVGGGERIDLTKRANLARIVAYLAATAPFASSLEELVAVGWPGERMVAGAGAIRLRVAIATLRRLGLEDRIVTTTAARVTSYAFRGRVEIRD